MSDCSRIEWTQATWNPTTGCDRISPGCDHYYALTLARRLKVMGSPKYQTDGDPRTSGPSARPINPDWVRAIRDTTQACGVAFFHKQWGGPHPHRSGRLLDGRTWYQTPAQPDDPAAELGEVARG
jgi:protein gp37